MASTPEGGRQAPLALFSLTAGPRFGEELAVPRPVATIGRAAGSDLLIDDDSVSAAHARLEFDLGAWRLTDLGSTNGTSVEGVKLAPNVPTPLQYGNTVRFGGVRTQFREVTGADPGAARAQFAPPPPPRTLAEERRGFRLPVWLLLVILLLAAVAGYAVYELVQDSGAVVPAPVEQAPPAAASP